MNREILQQALDALERVQPQVHGAIPVADVRDAITALRSALAAPEPEPVMEFKGRRLTPEGTRECWGMLLCKPEQDPARGALLYAAPPAAPAPAAPVVPDLKHCACEFDGDTCVTQCKLHAAHVDAIHEWAERAKAAEAKLSAATMMPLTDEQIRSKWMSSEFRGNGGQVDWFCEGIRAAEAHHGITGGKP